MPNNESEYYDHEAPEFVDGPDEDHLVGTKVRKDYSKKVETLKPHKVIVWNDEEHSFPFVMEVLMQLCNKSEEDAFKITKEIHENGKGVVFEAHKELAELKRDQIATKRDPLAAFIGAPNIPLNVTIESD